MALGVLSLVVSIAALGGVWYTRKQLELVVSDSHDKGIWAAKHAEAVRLVRKTNNWILNTPCYPLVFTDPEFRSLIETYIVEVDSQKNFVSARILEADQFLLPNVQEVIQKTLAIVEKFRRERPTESAKLGL